MTLASPVLETRRRRHGAQLTEAILDAAWAELLAHGYSSLTFVGVAEVAGTNRSVINRHWESKDDLVRAAIKRASDQFILTDPQTGSLREDTRALLGQLNDAFTLFAAAATAQLATFFDETGITPAELRLTLIDERWALIESVAHRAAAQGEIDASRLTPRILRLPYDLLRHEALMNLAVVPDTVIDEIVDEIYLPLLARQPNLAS